MFYDSIKILYHFQYSCELIYNLYKNFLHNHELHNLNTVSDQKGRVLSFIRHPIVNPNNNK